jgi:hypothetical protein
VCGRAGWTWQSRRSRTDRRMHEACTWLAGSRCGELRHRRQVTIYDTSQGRSGKKNERTGKQLSDTNSYDSLAVESAFGKTVISSQSKLKLKVKLMEHSVPCSWPQDLLRIREKDASCSRPTHFDLREGKYPLAHIAEKITAIQSQPVVLSYSVLSSYNRYELRRRLSVSRKKMLFVNRNKFGVMGNKGFDTGKLRQVQRGHGLSQNDQSPLNMKRLSP